MENLKLDLFKDKLVLVVYSEEGEICNQKAILKDFDSNFIYLKTHSQTLAVGISTIIKIKMKEGIES